MPSDGLPIYIDGDLNPAEWGRFGLRGHVETAIFSTSSVTFQDGYSSSVEDLRAAVLEAGAVALLFKESRGGARLFTAHGVVSAPAFVREVVHSIGVALGGFSQGDEAELIIRRLDVRPAVWALPRAQREVIVRDLLDLRQVASNPSVYRRRAYSKLADRLADWNPLAAEGSCR